MKNKKLVVEITLFVVLSLLSIGSLSYSIYTYNNPKVIYVKGEKGEDGKDGEQGPPGKDGVDGTNGVDGVDGINGRDGVDGVDGKDGTNGKDGVDGKDGKDGRNGSTGAKGEKGDRGEQGPQGEQGIQGPKGENGKDGSSFLTGNGEPTPSLGKDGDTYLDLLTYKLYSKSNGTWSFIGSLKDESSSRSIEETTTTYTISITPSSNGSISADKTTANKDEVVTFTIVPGSLQKLSKFYINGREYRPDSYSSGYTPGNITISYTMQNKNIVVSAEYEMEILL